MSYIPDPLAGWIPVDPPGGCLPGKPTTRPLPMTGPMHERLTSVFVGPAQPGVIVGTCSKCRGPVSVPALIGSVVPPVPTCQQCGAKKKSPYGPVVEMD